MSTRRPKSSLRERFLAFDERLAKLGVPPLTAWWRDGIGRWLDAYEGGGALELWACVGRGAAKSTALYKLATFFSLFGDFAIPAGERHFAIILSRLKEEAGKGVDIIAAWLGLLGVAHRASGDVIELIDLPRGIRVVAASVAAASGWRAYFVGRDERAKWPISGVDERDAEEIDTSAVAMTSTHARAPLPTFGSAWITLGVFHETIATGTTADRVVLGPTATWVAAPHITEESCRKKEPNATRFAREYGAIATDAADEAIFTGELIDRAMRAESGDLPAEDGVAYSAAMDPSLGANGWTLAIGGMRGGKASIVAVREWRAPHGEKLDPAAVLSSIAAVCRPYGVRRVVTDQFHAESLAAIAYRLDLGIVVVVDKPTVREKLERYEGAAVRFADGGVELPRDRTVRADLLAVRRRVTRGLDNFTIHMATTADGRHADHAPSIVLLLAQLPRDVARAERLAARAEQSMQIVDLWDGGPQHAEEQALIRRHGSLEQAARAVIAVTSGNSIWLDRDRRLWNGRLLSEQSPKADTSRPQDLEEFRKWRREDEGRESRDTGPRFRRRLIP